jgi:hypothetical protein
MATETPELTQNEPSEARHAQSPSVAHALQEKLAGDGSPATPMLQLVLAAGTVLVMGVGAMLSSATLVPPPPSMRVQALSAAPARPQPARPVPPPARMAPAPVLEAAAPTPAPAPAEPAAAPAQPTPTAAAALPPSPAALPTAAPAEPPAARHVEAAPKSHGKKPHRPPASTRKRASTKPADSAAPAATRPHRSAS